FDLLRRLGQLHLRLAACRVEGRETHLRRARYYLQRAVDTAGSGREAQIARSLLEIANSPNPLLDPAGLPGDFGPPPRMDEEMIRYRIAYLESQVGENPRSARLLARLGDSYTALYQTLKSRGPHRFARIWEASSVNDPEEARRL